MFLTDLHVLATYLKNLISGKVGNDYGGLQARNYMIYARD